MNRKAHQVARYVVGWLCWVVPALTLAGCKGKSPTLPQPKLSCPSLIAHWKMDDPAGPSSTFITDSAGNHNGALKECTGSPISIGTGFGPKIVSIIPPLGTLVPAPDSSQALFFVRSYAEVNHDNSLNIDPQCGFRIEMWVDTAGPGFNQAQPLLDKFDTNNGYALYLDSWDNNTDTWRLVFQLNNSDPNNPTVALSGFPMKQWRRVVVKVEPSGTVTLCRDTDGNDANGYEACNSTTVSPIATTNTNPLWIAATRLFPFNDPVPPPPGCSSLPFHPAAELALDEVKIFGQP